MCFFLLLLHTFFIEKMSGHVIAVFTRGVASVRICKIWVRVIIVIIVVIVMGEKQSQILFRRLCTFNHYDLFVKV